MGYVGWSSVSNQSSTETGGALGVVFDVSSALDVGLGVGGSGMVNTYSGAPPSPPTEFGFFLLEAGVANYLLLESLALPDRLQLE